MTEAGGRTARRGEVQKGKAIYNLKNKLILCLCGQGLLCTGYSVGCLISLAGQEDPVFVQAGRHGSERQPITFSFEWHSFTIDSQIDDRNRGPDCPGAAKCKKARPFTT